MDEDIRRFGRLLNYGGVLALVLCVSAGYSLVHAPTIGAISDTTARIVELEMLVQNAPIMREQHKKVSAKLHEVTTRIADVQRRVPNEADANGFLKELTALANSESLAIKDFHPEPPENRSGYAEMKVTLKGSGSFASICSFVDRLTRLQRLAKVKDLTLTAESSATEYPLTATVVIYFGLRGKAAVLSKEGRHG